MKNDVHKINLRFIGKICINTLDNSTSLNVLVYEFALELQIKCESFV
jgi:hypothetical protein